jgi:hypothetical protein
VPAPSPLTRILDPQTYAAQEALHQIAVGAHGPAPQDPEFGANVFHVGQPTPVGASPGVVGINTHGWYWNEGTDALNNQAAIIVGQYDKVTYDRRAR